MKIIAFNGSPRKGRYTTQMLEMTLEAAAGLGAETELVHLADCHIEYCRSCNRCLRQTVCSIENDDTAGLHAKMVAADGILLGSPVFFSNVSGQMKTFMDRTRPLHMTRNLLKGKIGGAVVNAGLRNGGQEMALNYLEKFLHIHGLLVADGSDPLDQEERSLYNGGPTGTLYCSSDAELNISWYKKAAEDPLMVHACHTLGRNMVLLYRRLKDGPASEV